MLQSRVDGSTDLCRRLDQYQFWGVRVEYCLISVCVYILVEVSIYICIALGVPEESRLKCRFVQNIEPISRRVWECQKRILPNVIV